jgi:hypothetical protein
MSTSWERMLDRRRHARKTVKKFINTVAGQKTDFAKDEQRYYRQVSPTHSPGLITLTSIREDDEEYQLVDKRSLSSSSQSSSTLLIQNMYTGGGDTWNAESNGASQWNDSGNNDDARKWNDGGANGDAGFNDGGAADFGGDAGQGGDGDGAANGGACHNCGQGESSPSMRCLFN